MVFTYINHMYKCIVFKVIETLIALFVICIVLFLANRFSIDWINWMSTTYYNNLKLGFHIFLEQNGSQSWKLGRTQQPIGVCWRQVGCDRLFCHLVWTLVILKKKFFFCIFKCDSLSLFHILAKWLRLNSRSGLLACPMLCSSKLTWTRPKTLLLNTASKQCQHLFSWKTRPK